MADNNNYMYQRMMREAMMRSRSTSGGGGRNGIIPFIADAINGYRAKTQENADEDMLQTGLQAEYEAGVKDPRQALMNVLQKNPVLIAHDAFRDNSMIQEMLHPPSRQYFAAGPGSTIFDAGTGKPTATVPGKPGLGFSSEVQQALVAAGWKGDAAPTEAQYAGAAKLLGNHLQRNPTEFESIMGALNPAQKQQYLEHLAGNNPNTGIANQLTKLNGLADQAEAAGNGTLAQQYRTAAQKLSELGGIMSLLQGGMGTGSSGNPTPPNPGAPTPTPSGNDNTAPPVPPEKPPVPDATGGDDNTGAPAAPPSSPTIDPQAAADELRRRGIIQ